MKRLISILLAVILIFSMTACQSSLEPAPEHTLAETPQIVDDPVFGYCGNTMTTIVVDGQEYTFMGSDSVNLTDILINLKYDPNRICDCLPEFSVKTEFGDPYGVNLSEGYVRCDDGQADLTEAQIDLIREILGNQA